MAQENPAENSAQHPPERTVFFVSDHTGITAEVLGHSLLVRFEGLGFRYVTRPFVDSLDKAAGVVEEIKAAARSGARPVVFSTLSDPTMLAGLNESDALLFDVFAPYMARLERELGRASSKRVGRSHGIVDLASYQMRIDAVDFALTTDDGLGTTQYQRADIILVGASRVGKTPTCLFLALQYGVRASNYPLAEEDFERSDLPEALSPYRNKVFGLTIDPLRLHGIRKKRRAGSVYASLERCDYEVREAERLFRSRNIRFLNTTTASVEEIAATIMQTADLQRRLY